MVSENVFRMITERRSRQIDAFIGKIFAQYGYSRDQVIKMVADGRIKRQEKTDVVLVNGEPYFHAQYVTDDLDGMAEIKVKYIKEPIYKEDEV